MKKLFIFLFLLMAWVILMLGVAQMPKMGDPTNPTNTHVAPRYLKEGPTEAGAENIVTDVILNYRGYDTMGEVTVIFTALCAVLAVLKREKAGKSRSDIETSQVEPSVIVKTIVTIFFPFIFLFAVYVILHGETSPGGGFQGGAILGAGFIIFSLIFGFSRGLKKLPLKLRTLMESTAPISFFLVGIIGLLFGLSFLTYMIPAFSPHAQHAMVAYGMLFIEIGIGVGGAAIFTSIFFSMHKEEKS